MNPDDLENWKIPNQRMVVDPPIYLRGTPPKDLQNKGMPPRGHMVLDPIVLNGKPPPQDPTLPSAADNLGVRPMAPPPEKTAAAPAPPDAPQSSPSSMSILQDPEFRAFVQRRATDLANAQQDAAARQKWANLANGFQRARAWGNSVAPDQGSIDQKNAYANLPVQQAKERAASGTEAIKDVDVASQAGERGIKSVQLQASLDPNSPLSRNSLLLARAQGMVPPGYNGPFSASMAAEMEKGASLQVAKSHWEAEAGIARAHLDVQNRSEQEKERHNRVEEQFMYQKPLPPQSVTELESLLSGVKAVDALKAQKGDSSLFDKVLSKLPGDLGDFAQTKNATAGAIAAAEAKGRTNPSGAIREKQLLPGAFQGDTGLDQKRKQLLDTAEQRLNVLEAGGARPNEVAEYRAQLNALKGDGGSEPRAAGGAGGAGGAARVKNDADYAALPSGAVFIGPDGKQRKKP